MRREQLAEAPDDWNRARLAVLRVAQDGDAPLQIDIVEGEAKDLALPCPCRNGEDDDRVEMLVLARLAGGQKSLALLVAQEKRTLVADLGDPVHAIDRVASGPAPLLRELEEQGDHVAIVLQGLAALRRGLGRGRAGRLAAGPLALAGNLGLARRRQPTGVARRFERAHLLRDQVRIDIGEGILPELTLPVLEAGADGPLSARRPEWQQLLPVPLRHIAQGLGRGLADDVLELAPTDRTLGLLSPGLGICQPVKGPCLRREAPHPDLHAVGRAVLSGTLLDVRHGSSTGSEQSVIWHTSGPLPPTKLGCFQQTSRVDAVISY